VIAHIKKEVIMDIKVDINPEEVNKAVSEAIIKSTIGAELEKAVQAQVKILTSNSFQYKNVFENIIKREIEVTLRDLIQDKYSQQIKEFVTANVTENFTADLLNKMWCNLNEGRY
jgi:hypothetical protein